MGPAAAIAVPAAIGVAGMMMKKSSDDAKTVAANPPVMPANVQPIPILPAGEGLKNGGGSGATPNSYEELLANARRNSGFNIS